MSEIFPPDKVACVFRQYVRRHYPDLKTAATRFGCSVSYVSAVQCGRKAPNAAMLKALGLTKVTGYRRAVSSRGPHPTRFWIDEALET